MHLDITFTLDLRIDLKIVSIDASFIANAGDWIGITNNADSGHHFYGYFDINVVCRFIGLEVFKYDYVMASADKPPDLAPPTQPTEPPTEDPTHDKRSLLEADRYRQPVYMARYMSHKLQQQFVPTIAVSDKVRLNIHSHII